MQLGLSNHHATPAVQSCLSYVPLQGLCKPPASYAVFRAAARSATEQLVSSDDLLRLSAAERSGQVPSAQYPCCCCCCCCCWSVATAAPTCIQHGKELPRSFSFCATVCLAVVAGDDPALSLSLFLSLSLSLSVSLSLSSFLLNVWPDEKRRAHPIYATLAAWQEWQRTRPHQPPAHATAALVFRCPYQRYTGAAWPSSQGQAGSVIL